MRISCLLGLHEASQYITLNLCGVEYHVCGRMAKMLSDEQLLDLAYIHVPRGWPKTITECDFERSKAEYLQRMRQEINRFALATRFERWRV